MVMRQREITSHPGGCRQRGASTVGYALLLGLIGITAIGALSQIGGSIVGLFSLTGITMEEATLNNNFDLPFQDVDDALPGTEAISNTVTIPNLEGEDVILPFSVSGPGNPALSVNGGVFASTGSVTEGDELRLRLTTSLEPDELHVVTLSIDGRGHHWRVTNQSILDGLDESDICTISGSNPAEEYPRTEVPPEVWCESAIFRLTFSDSSQSFFIRPFEGSTSLSAFYNPPDPEYRVNTGSGFTDWIPDNTYTLIDVGDLVQVRVHSDKYSLETSNALLRAYFQQPDGARGAQAFVAVYAVTTEDGHEYEPWAGFHWTTSDSDTPFGGAGTNNQDLLPGFWPDGDGDDESYYFEATNPVRVLADNPDRDLEIRLYETTIENNLIDPLAGPLPARLRISSDQGASWGPEIELQSNEWLAVSDGDYIQPYLHTSDYKDEKFRYTMKIRDVASGVQFGSDIDYNLTTGDAGVDAELPYYAIDYREIIETPPGDHPNPGSRNDSYFHSTAADAHNVYGDDETHDLCLVYGGFILQPNSLRDLELDDSEDPQIFIGTPDGGGGHNFSQHLPVVVDDCIPVHAGDAYYIVGHPTDYHFGQVQYNFRLEDAADRSIIYTAEGHGSSNLGGFWLRTDETGLDLPSGGFE